MFTSLRSRLWLTYTLLVGGVICVIGVGLVIYLVRNPYPSRQAVQRLELVSLIIQQRELTARDIPLANLQVIIQRADALFDTRLIIYRPDGAVVIDSRGENSPPLPHPTDPQPGIIRPANYQLRDEQGVLWLYAARPLEDGNLLVVASPRPRITLRQLARDDFLTPFIQAGAVALIFSLLLAYWISRWVVSPLKRMSIAARAVASGNFQEAPLAGPDEVKELAGAFNAMTAQVQVSQQTQRDFVDNVSHDLKTPLTSIQGFAQAILEGAASPGEETKHAAQVIFSEAGQMNRLVIDLLDLARFDAGMIKMERETVNLGQLLQDAVSKFSPQADQANIAMTTNISPPTNITGDGDRLAQVFTNLLDNALKHTPAGGHVQVILQQAGSFAEISVIDNGEGIPDEELPRVFDRFYQVDKARSRSTQRGMGLGLSIARDIAQRHGGSITVNNNPQRGCTFMVKLPLVAADDTTVVRRRQRA